LILLDGDEDSNPSEQSEMLNKSNTESDMPERRRYGSIKKILSNQPLEKQEYVGKKFPSFFISLFFFLFLSHRN